MKKILEKINSSLYYFVKPANSISSSYSAMEQINFNALLFSSSLYLIFSSAFNFFELADYILTTFTIGCSLIFIYLYYLSRFKNYQNIKLTSIVILLLLSMSWFMAGGALGSISYIYIISLIVLIMITKKKQHNLIFYLFLTNLAILYFLEYYYGDLLIHPYTSEQSHSSDMIFTFILSLFFTFFLLRFFKSMYDDGREKLELQNKIIETQNEEHHSSMLYASDLQRKIISNEGELKFLFKDYFILFKPKDVVTGDFYWVKQKDEYGVIVVADCTGHGVPAAFLSILGISILDDIAEQMKDLWMASKFLERLRFKFTFHFQKVKELENKITDSMDVGLLLINYTESTIQFAGANRPLLLIRNNDQPIATNYSDIHTTETHTLYSFKGTKNTIGNNDLEQPFINNTFEFYPNDTFYLFSDGYADQFDSNDKKKFKIEQLKKELLKIQDLPMTTQGEYLQSIHKHWKGNTEQTDDILIVGNASIIILV